MKGKIFNAQEVQAIIAGNKTQFREVIEPYPILSDDKSYWQFKGVIWAGENSSYAKNFGDNARPVMPDLCPYQVGQKIFCKESFDGYADSKLLDKYNIFYRADGKLFKGSSWKPAQHMKQEHSRLTLEITDIKVERLQDISKKDCIKEGIEKMWLEENEDFPRYTFGKHSFFEVKEVFRDWWNSTHKKPEEKFEVNPFVWVVEFKINK